VVYIILEFLQKFNPIEQALFATLFTWGVTALGSALVFFFKTINTGDGLTKANLWTIRR